MGSNWPVVRLGNHCLKIGSGATPKGGSSVYSDSGSIWLIRSQNIYNDGFNPSGLVFISEDAADKLKNVIVQENDILLNITGDSVARVCLAKKEYLPARVNQHVAIIRPDPKHFDARYLRYVLASPVVQQILLNLASAGATRNALTKVMIEEFEVLKPPLSIQIAVADHLESFDDKITLNRQINQTLEQMAQTLFKSWFVDFDPVIDNALDAGNDIPDTLQERAEQRRLLRAKADFKPLPAETRALFPSEFEDSELGWVPKGWEGVSIANMCDMVTNGGTPNRATKEFWKDGDIPWYKTGEFSDGFLLTPSERITHAAIAGSSVKLLPENSVLMAIYAAPTVGRLGVLTETSAFNQACTGMVPKAAIGTRFLFLTLYFARDWFNNRANGAAQQNISKAIVENYLAIVPSQDVLTLFNKNMEDLFAKIRFNSEQIQRLSILRDTLLPKLISGELELDALPEAPELAEAR